MVAAYTLGLDYQTPNGDDQNQHRNKKNRNFYKEIFNNDLKKIIFEKNQLDLVVYRWCYNKLVKTLEAARNHIKHEKIKYLM